MKKGSHHTEGTKARMSESHKGHPSPAKGTKRTMQARIKQSQAQLGRKHSEETKRKISLSHLGKNNPFYGRQHTEASRKLMSVATQTEERRQALAIRNAGMVGEGNPMFGRKHSEETKEKIRISLGDKLAGSNNPMYGRIGDKHPLWKGGLSREPYPLGFDNGLKAYIRERDDYTCQVCSITEVDYGATLCCHHINYNKKDISEDNLISLCQPCNVKANFDRVYWQEFFKEKIREKTGTLRGICPNREATEPIMEPV